MKFKENVASHASWLIGLFLSAISAQVLAEAQTPARALQVGLLPISTTRTLIGNYQPLRAYLEQELKRPVELVSAPNFRAFHASTIKGDYDLVVTAAHFGRIAETDAEYVPLARYKAPHRTLLLVAKDQPLKSIQDLRGKVVAGIDPTALAVNETVLWLRKQGLRAGSDYTLLETPTPISAAYSVQNHQSALAISSPQGMKQMPENVRESVEIFASLPELPSLMWMAHPRMAAEVPKLKAALLGFTTQSQEGALFFEATGYMGMRAVTQDETKAMDALADEVSTRLNEKK
jgi:phosphonate transport system substrate-binding protein